MRAATGNGFPSRTKAISVLVRPLRAVALTALALLPCVPGGAAPVLRNPLPIPVPGRPSHLAKADFNGDGHRDVLASEATELFTLIADGSGPFAEAVSTATIGYIGDRPGVGDLDGDGLDDVAVTRPSTDTVTVFLSNGDGSFRNGSSFATLDLPGPAAVADFNGDLKADIAVASWGSTVSSEIAVHLGDGTGGFGPPQATSLGTGLLELVPARLNADGRTDLVARSASATYVLLANSLGTFTWSRLSSQAGPLCVADFDDDGKADLAAANEIGRERGTVTVRHGNGDGTFEPPSSHLIGYGWASLDAADVDDDGVVDLLASTEDGSTVAVLHGRSAAAFGPAQFWVTGPAPFGIVASDFDRDGFDDILSLDSNANTYTLSFIRGRGEDGFDAYRAFHTRPAARLDGAPLQPQGGRVADMNGDGAPDVIVMQKNTGDSNHSIGVLLNDGSGRLSAPVLSPTGLAPSYGPPYAVDDVDGDGNTDVVVVSGVARTFLGDGTGALELSAERTAAGASMARLGRFDADAVPDLFLVSSTTVSVFPGQGDGSFGTPKISAVDYSGVVVVADLDADGPLDFVHSSAAAQRACLNDGTGNFTCSLITSGDLSASAVGDFTEDGVPDVLFASRTGTVVWAGHGDGTFELGRTTVMRPDPMPVVYPQPPTAADFDGDGKLDIAFGAAICLGNGDGTFRERWAFATVGVDFAAAADMDGSGSPDLVVTKSTADDVGVLLTMLGEDPVAAAEITLTPGQVTTSYGSSVVFRASVSAPESEHPIPPHGAIRFTIDGVPSALVAVDLYGDASWTVPFTPGLHQVSATHTGDEHYLPSSASADVETVKATTVLTVAGSPNPRQNFGYFTVTVDLLPRFSASGQPGPTGSITLRNGDTPLDRTFSPPGGSSRFYGFAVGSHVITAEYPGDENFEPSSASYTQEITQAPPDTAPPAGTVMVYPGTGYVSSPAVQLLLQASDGRGITGYLVSNQPATPSASDAAWVATTEDSSLLRLVDPWTLTEGPTMTVYAWFRDAAGNVSARASATVTLDDAAPEGSLTLNSGAGFARASWIPIELSATDGHSLAGYYVTNTAEIPDAGSTLWNRIDPDTSFQLSLSAWSLLPGDGERTVRAWFKDAARNVSSATASLLVDSVRPSSGTLSAAGDVRAVRLAWEGQTDGGSGIAGYRLAFATGSTAPPDCAGTSLDVASPFVHAGLANAATYSYRLCAVDRAGNHSIGATALAMTIDDRRKGDVNNSDTVTALDAAQILQMVVGTVVPGPIDACAADFDGSGTYSALDAARVLQCVVDPSSCSTATCR